MCFNLVHALKCILSQRRKYEKRKVWTLSQATKVRPDPYDTFSLIKFPSKTV